MNADEKEKEKIFHEVIYDYLKLNNEQITKSVNLDITHRNIKILPFDIYYTINNSNKEKSLEFKNLNGKYIYYDNEVIQKDKSIIIKIKPKSTENKISRIVVFMNEDWYAFYYYKQVKCEWQE